MPDAPRAVPRLRFINVQPEALATFELVRE